MALFIFFQVNVTLFFLLFAFKILTFPSAICFIALLFCGAGVLSGIKTGSSVGVMVGVTVGVTVGVAVAVGVTVGVAVGLALFSTFTKHVAIFPLIEAEITASPTPSYNVKP